MIRTAARRRAAFAALLAGIVAGTGAATRDAYAGSPGKGIELNGFAGAGTFLNGVSPDGPGPDRAKIAAKGKPAPDPDPKRASALVVAKGGNKPDASGNPK